MEIARGRGLKHGDKDVGVVELLVGMFGHSIVIMQSARDAVLLRVLGVTKKRVRCMLVLGQVFLCLTGVLIVAGGLCLYSPGLFLKSQ